MPAYGVNTGQAFARPLSLRTVAAAAKYPTKYPTTDTTTQCRVLYPDSGRVTESLGRCLTSSPSRWPGRFSPARQNREVAVSTVTVQTSPTFTPTLTPHAAADYIAATWGLSVNESTIRRWARKGALEATAGDRGVLVDREGLHRKFGELAR